MANTENNCKNKLGVLVVGLGGAVASTFVIGTLSVRKGFSKPIGSVSQLSEISIKKDGKITEPLIKDIIPIAKLEDIVFGGWDIFPESVYDAALHAEVLTKEDIEKVAQEAKQIKPMPGAFDQEFVKRLNGTHTKSTTNKWELAQKIAEDIRNFKKENNLERVVVIWAASTEIYVPMSETHMNIESLEKAMKDNSKEIAPSMCYAYAAIKEGVPFINGAPALTVDMPALMELAIKNKVAICGKDFKTGQTMMKTVLSPKIGRAHV